MSCNCMSFHWPQSHQRLRHALLLIPLGFILDVLAAQQHAWLASGCAQGKEINKAVSDEPERLRLVSFEHNI